MNIFLHKTVFNWLKGKLMYSGSKGIPGVWKARTEKEVETMMTELKLFKEFAICSIDELRDEEIRMAETTSFCLSERST